VDVLMVGMLALRLILHLPLLSHPRDEEEEEDEEEEVAQRFSR
jgi:hypothetical protein